MIYVLLPYYPSNANFDLLKSCLDKQKKAYWIKQINAEMNHLYWGQCMNNLLHDIQTDSNIHDSDLVCFMNTDIYFPSWFFSFALEHIKQGEILVPYVYESGIISDGGIHIDWRRKQFNFTRRDCEIDCFSPRGVFMTVKDFRESGGFLFPHNLSDYDWSIRQIKRGMKVVRPPEFYVSHVPHESNSFPFSVRDKRNPIYWTKFLWWHCPKRYLLKNLVKAWLPQ
jgi:GT2 family glycosyltransferase